MQARMGEGTPVRVVIPVTGHVAVLSLRQGPR